MGENSEQGKGAPQDRIGGAATLDVLAALQKFTG
jgi:hypothetical protein